MTVDVIYSSEQDDCKKKKNEEKEKTVTNVYSNVGLNVIFNEVLTFTVFALIL